MKESKETRLDGSMLWEYRLHEDTIFYQRLNVFLVAESMLLVAFALLFSSPEKSFFVPLIVVILGCFLTAAWLYVSHRQMVVINQIRMEAEKAVPTYRKIRKDRPKVLLGSMSTLTYIVPSIVFLIWLALLAALLYRRFGVEG